MRFNTNVRDCSKLMKFNQKTFIGKIYCNVDFYVLKAYY